MLTSVFRNFGLIGLRHALDIWILEDPLPPQKKDSQV